MTVCFFGSYDPSYARNKILIDGLQKNGAKVLHCRSNAGSVFTRYPELISQFLKIKDQVDVIYVAFVGHLDVPLAWVLGKLFAKKVVFDMFYSMYDTYVFDRQNTSTGSVRAWLYYCIDAIAATLADAVVTDTKSHAKFIIKTFHQNPHKFHRIFVGGDDTLFQPRSRKINKRVIIEFHGMLTRLQGAEYFIEAAKKLENHKEMKFWFIGNSLGYDVPLQLIHKLRLTNVSIFPKLPLAKLAEKVAQADITVGHLGTTDKAHRVISNKMYHALFSRIALIAPDTDATRELLRDRIHALFVKPGNPDDLVAKIAQLVKDKSLRKRLAEKGYGLVRKKLNNVQIGKDLLFVLRSLA